MKTKRMIVMAVIAVLAVLTACGAQNSTKERLKDVYVDSFRCGYLSQKQKPERGIVLISTVEELDYARKNLGVGYPDDYDEKRYRSYNTDIVKAFEKMEAGYPIDSYSYLIKYEEVGSAGYDFHADGVERDKESGNFSFHYDKNTYPKAGKGYAQVMDGFFHMAAVPKELITEGK